MKIFQLFFLCLIIFSCNRETEEEKFKRLCPYTFRYNTAVHFLKMPIKVSPNLLKYKIGDTITFTSIFSDSIYDVNLKKTFLIKDMPFKPFVTLTKFTEEKKGKIETLKSAYYVDSIYQPQYTAGIICRTVYENGLYKFEMKIIPNEKGKYIYMCEDFHNVLDRKELIGLTDEVYSIDFTGKCHNIRIEFCNVIEGEDHLDSFIPELKFLDTNNNDNFNSIEGFDHMTIYSPGSLIWEFSGTYGFEVE